MQVDLSVSPTDVKSVGADAELTHVPRQTDPSPNLHKFSTDYNSREIRLVQLNLGNWVNSVSAPTPTAKELAAQAKGEWSYWAKWQFTHFGRLQVLLNEGYGGKIVDSDSRPVELQLNKLVGLMASRAVEFLVRKERQAVEDAERQRSRDIALERKRRQDVEKQRLAKLEVDAQNWRRVQAIREYLNALEQHAERHEPSAEQLELHCGRAKADWIDPLKPHVVDVLDEEIAIPR